MENIIYVAAPRDWFDYISSILTFTFSLVAIIIAVSTARRQNKIALFEKKYDTYCEIQKLTCLARSIKNYMFVKHPSEHTHISQVFNAMKKPSANLYSMAIIFGFQYNESMDTNEKLRVFLSEIKRIEQKVNSTIFLFPCIKPKVIQDMVSTCQDYIYYMVNASNDLTDIARTGGDDETARAFIDACSKFDELCATKIEKDLLL